MVYIHIDCHCGEDFVKDLLDGDSGWFDCECGCSYAYASKKRESVIKKQSHCGKTKAQAKTEKYGDLISEKRKKMNQEKYGVDENALPGDRLTAVCTSYEHDECEGAIESGIYGYIFCECKCHDH